MMPAITLAILQERGMAKNPCWSFRTTGCKGLGAEVGDRLLIAVLLNQPGDSWNAPLIAFSEAAKPQTVKKGRTKL
jgi:hypothetical protein